MKNVDLALDRHAGLVSPQFHTVCDPKFQTVTEDIFDSLWQTKAGFVTTKELAETKQKSKSKNQTKASEGAKPQQASKGRKRPRSAPSMNEMRSHQQNNAHYQQQAEGRATKRGRPNSYDQNDQQDRSRSNLDTTKTTRSGQRVKPIDRLMMAMKAEISNSTVDDIEGEIFCLQAIYPDIKMDPFQQELENDPLLAFKATADPDTMHMHQAMKQLDKKQFIKAMRKDWQDQIENGNCSVMHRSKELTCSPPHGK